MRIYAIFSFLTFFLLGTPFAAAEPAASISVSPLSYVGKEPAPPPQAKSDAVATISVSPLSYIGKEPSPAPDEKSNAVATIQVGGLSYIGGTQQPQAKPTSAPLPKNETNPEKNTQTPHPTSQTKKATTKTDGRVLSIKLLSYKPMGGTNPFSLKDVSKLGQEPKLAAPEKQPERSTESGSQSPTPSASPSAPDNSPVPTVVTRSAAPTGFTCSGKTDGQYCKDANTQVFCYHDAIANTQNCPSGCNETTNSCNAYKP